MKRNTWLYRGSTPPPPPPPDDSDDLSAVEIPKPIKDDKPEPDGKPKDDE